MTSINPNLTNNTIQLESKGRINPFVMSILIRSIRISQNYTLLDLQKKTSIHKALLLAFEIGWLEPSSTDIFGITKACHVPIDEFYYIASNMSNPQVNQGQLDKHIVMNDHIKNRCSSEYAILNTLRSFLDESYYRDNLH